MKRYIKRKGREERRIYTSKEKEERREEFQSRTMRQNLHHESNYDLILSYRNL